MHSKFNDEKNISINIESSKASFFPGEIISGTITLFPFIQSFEKIMANPSLNITITQLKRYSYSTGSGKNRRTVIKHENKNIGSTIVDFGSIVSVNYSAGFKVPFSIQIPIDAAPSINFTLSGYVKHLLVVELPDLKAKRAKMFAIKGDFPNNFDNTLLRNMIEGSIEYKKSKLFFDKGSCLLNLKMPKNYFFFNEQIPFEINLDYSNLKMEIKSIKVSLYRRARKNNSQDYSKIQRSSDNELNNKTYNIEKGSNNFHISDFLEFPTYSDYNSVYPPKVYASFDEHGLLEINDEKFSYYLYPSSINGLVTVDYFIDVKIYFDSSLTFDEEFIVLLYFSSNFENNMNQVMNKGVSSSISSVSTNIDNYNNSINANFTSQ